jgi:cysteinyl-tRNA synthetase
MKTGAAKMSKSAGNEIVVSELLKRYEPETLRFFLLSTHYRRPIDYSEERLQEIYRGLEGFYRLCERFERITGTSFYSLEAPTRKGSFDAKGTDNVFLAEVERLRESFLEHMDDDFNTGGAIGVLYELLSVLNRFADTKQLEANRNAPVVADFRRAIVALKELSLILGIFQQPQKAPAAGNDEVVSGLMKLLIDLRAEARKSKSFAIADQIRKRLADLKITLEDRPGGTDWRIG